MKKITNFYPTLIVNFVGALLLAACLSLSACGGETDADKYTRLMSEADKYIAEEQYDHARLSLLNAADAQPERPEPYFQLAEVLVELQKYAEAVENYQASINRDPKSVKARSRLAALLMAGGQRELAASEAQKILEIEPENADAMVLLANIARAKNQPVEALETLNKILAKNPEHVAALANKAALLLFENKLDEAEALYKKALALEPDNQIIHLAMAELLVRRGQMDDAQTELQKIVERHPNNSGLHYMFAEFLLGRGFGDKALEQYELALKADPKSNVTRDRLYDIYLSRSEEAKARALTKDLIALDTKDGGITFFQGRDAELDKDFEGARKLYMQAMVTMGNFAPVFRRVGLLEFAKGDYNEGLEHLNQAVAIDSTDIGARLALARYFFARRDIGQASEHVGKILQKFPRQLGANILNADIMLHQGDKDGPRKVYTLLAQNYPNNPTGFLKLALLEEASGNTDASIQWYEKALGFDSNVLLPASRYVRLLLMKEKGFDSALQKMEELESKSEHSKAEYKYLRGTLLLSKQNATPDDLAAARKLYMEALEIQPKLLPAYLGLAQLDQMSSDLDAAIVNYNKLLEINPKNLPTKMILGTIYELQGKYELAVEQYRGILAVDKNFGPAANNLAWVLTEFLNGDLDEALRLAQVAKEQLPDESSVADTLGWVYYRRGQGRLGLSYIEEALDLHQKAAPGKSPNPEIVYHLGVVKKSVGDTAGANAAFQQALALLPADSALRAKIEQEMKS